MKKNISNLFLLFCFFLFLPIAQANSTIDELTKAIQKSLLSNYFQTIEEGEFIWGEDRLNYKAELTQDNTKRKIESELKLNLGTNKILSDLEEELNLGNLQIQGNLTTLSYFDENNQDGYYEITNYDTTVKTDELESKIIIEGFLEIPKFFTNKKYYFNSQKIIENFPEETQEQAELNFQVKLSKQEIVSILNGILKTGIFDITVNANTYTIQIAQELKELNTAELKKAIQSIQNLSSDLKDNFTSIIDELSLENEDLQEFKNFIDFSSQITLQNSKIKEITTKVDFNLQKLISEKEGKEVDLEIDNLSINDTTTFTYQTKTFPWPNENKINIDLNKIISAFITLEKKAYAQMEEEWANWEMDASDESLDDSDLNEETEIDLENDLLPEDAWYTPYIRDLIFREIIKKPNEVAPANKIIPRDVVSLMGNTTNYLESYCIAENLNSELQLNYSNQEEVSKYEALKFIIKTLFPEEKIPPATFAIRNEIVSNTFNAIEGQSQIANRAEFFTMLSKAINVYEEMHGCYE